MQIRQKITPAVLAAATGMLQPFIPELSPQSLIEALQKHEASAGIGTAANHSTEKPLTRQGAAALLSVSLNTVNRYMNRGILRRVKISSHTVRIDPASVRNLLEQGEA